MVSMINMITSLLFVLRHLYSHFYVSFVFSFILFVAWSTHNECSLFKRDPELRLFFFTYFNLPQEGTIDELRENSVLQNHAATVMNALDSIILIIDNVDQVVNTLSKVAIFHIKFADFHAHFFWVSGNSLGLTCFVFCNV
jgi:hypothetical protein